MNYGPYMKTFKGDKSRINGAFYWLEKKNNNYRLSFWNGKNLRNEEYRKHYRKENINCLLN
jgi:hypothetical protein